MRKREPIDWSEDTRKVKQALAEFGQYNPRQDEAKAFHDYREICYRRMRFRSMTVQQVLELIDNGHCGD